MKKLVFTLVLIISIVTFSKGQTSYSAAVGLGLDFGDGQTLVGPSGKYFFSGEHAGQGELLFGDDYTFIGVYYQYHGGFNGAEGLRWYAGGGPGFGFFDGGSTIFLRPMTGLDFKINNVPLSFSFDWRPAINFESNADNFEPARFGLGFRYAFD